MKSTTRTGIYARLLLALTTIAGVNACKEKNPAEPIHSEEHSPITTIELRLTPVSGDTLLRSILLRDTTLVTQRPAVVGSPLTLRSGAEYSGTVTLLNESASPTEDVSNLIDSESTSHTFSYGADGDISTRISFSDLSLDTGGKVYGRTFRLTLSAGQQAGGTITVRLYHYASGNKNDVPEIDREATFTTVIK